jgi:hypothetical protein
MRSFYSTGSMLGLFVVALAAQGCGNSGTGPVAPLPTSTPTAGPTSSPLALLVPGTTNQYSGTETQTISFASPTATTPNSNAAYAFAETDTISAAASGAPAPFDVHRVLSYTTTSAPSYGSQLISDTRDQYENVTTASSGAQTVTLAAVDGVTTGIDISSRLANGGSGAYSNSISNTYSPAQTVANYPLTTGATFQQSLADTATTQEDVATASGSETEHLSTTVASDDSYARTGTLFNTDSTTQTENSDGSATVTNTGVSPFTETIAVPTGASGSFVIPVTQNGTSYSPADYYPGSGAPPSPLGSVNVTVAGPATSLPSSCPAAGTYPNVIEIDTATNDLDVVSGSYTTTAQRVFNSNGLRICSTTASTVTTYALTTGLLKSTVTTNTATSLTSSTTSSKRRATRAPKRTL